MTFCAPHATKGIPIRRKERNSFLKDQVLSLNSRSFSAESANLSEASEFLIPMQFSFSKNKNAKEVFCFGIIKRF